MCENAQLSCNMFELKQLKTVQGQTAPHVHNSLTNKVAVQIIVNKIFLTLKISSKSSMQSDVSKNRL